MVPGEPACAGRELDILIGNEFLDTLASSEFNTLNNQFTLLLIEPLISESKDFYLKLIVYI